MNVFSQSLHIALICMHASTHIYKFGGRRKWKLETGNLWPSGKGKGLGCHYISGSIQLSCETKSYFPSHLHEYGLLHFDPFEYPKKGLYVGCTFHLEVRSVCLADPGLTFFSKKNKENGS